MKIRVPNRQCFSKKFSKNGCLFAIISKIYLMDRNKKLVGGLVSGVIIKVSALIFTLISVPMTLHYLGPEQYGIWVTMISILAWVSMVDLGIANGLTPLLVASLGKNENYLAKRYVATAFWSLTVISLLMGAVFFFFWGLIDWGGLFNIESEHTRSQVSYAMMLAIGLFLVNLPISITQRIYLADQNGFGANIWQFFGGLAGVFGIYLATKTQGGLVYLVLGYSGMQLFVRLVNSIWLFGWMKPELSPFSRPKFADVKSVMSLGSIFFVNQIATLIIFQKDNILISHYLGPLQATNYSVMWQIFFYFNTVNLIIAPYLGPAFGEAYVKKDLQWMRAAIFRYFAVTFLISLLGVCTLIMFYEEILTAWVGPGVAPEIRTVLWMAAWTMVLSVQWPIISLLNSVGKVKKYTFYYFLAAFINIFLSIALIKIIGITGGLISSFLTVLVIALIPSIRELKLIIKEAGSNLLIK